MGADTKAHLASKLSSKKPAVISVQPKEIWRLGFSSPEETHAKNFLNQLAQKAQIDKRGKIALLFVPFEMEAKLHRLEAKANKGGDVNNIRETKFRISSKEDGFEIKVIEIKKFD